MKRTIRLTESGLHRVIEESVKRILREAQEQIEYVWNIFVGTEEYGSDKRFDVVEHSNNTFSSPDEAYADGLGHLQNYNDGEYYLCIYDTDPNNHQRINGYKACSYNGRIIED